MILDRSIPLNTDECFFCLQTRLDIVVNILANILQEPSLTYIKQTLQFLFKFLRINLEEKTSCHDSYRDIKANANKPSANGKTSERKLTRSQLSTGYKRSYRTERYQ